MNVFKTEALQMRRDGYSYAMIRDRLGVSKSTLSNWLSGMPFAPNQELVKRIGEAKLKSALFRNQMMLADIRRMKRIAREDVATLSRRDIFMLGIGLYIGEGSKAVEEVKIVNSSPIVIRMAIRWLKEALSLSTRSLKIAVHTYPDNNPKEAVAFWSRETSIPISQFGKTIIDMRTGKSALRKHKLPYGTAHLYVINGGTLPSTTRSLHRRIMGWVEFTQKQI